VIGPAKYLDYVKKMTGGVARVATGHTLCNVCARKGVVKQVVPLSHI
jgi:hypothetical protein